MISRLNLRKRLFAGYLLPIFAIILIGITSVYLSRIIQAQFEEISQNTVPTVQALNDAKSAGLRIVASSNEFALLTFLQTDEGIEQEEDELLEGAQQYEEALATYEKIVLEENSPREVELLQKLKQTGQGLNEDGELLTYLIANKATDEEILAAKQELEKTEQAYLQVIDQALAQEAGQELVERDAYLDRTILNAYLLIGGLTLTTLLIILIVNFLIYRSIVQPVLRLQNATQRMARGEYHVRTDSESNDELGQLANAFNQMAESVHNHTTKMEEQKQQLQQSNADLQQFAYVASHDLQEPLRMVTSYLQLIERRYKDKLDTDATEFIAFAVDGATRMKTLIQALLTYSRVGTHAQVRKPVDSQVVLGQVLDNLQIAIEESNAKISYEALPTVQGDATQLAQLLQNLIGNALKFRGTRHLEIQIGAKKQRASTPEKEEHWQFWVRDNGIGIEPQYFERIFLIFQRLHTREEYPGTGLGLAICKRIVERHGGQMWLESQPGEGTTFYFSLPVTA